MSVEGSGEPAGRGLADGSPWEAVARFALDLSLALSLEDVVRSLVRIGVPALSADGCGVITRADDGGWQLALSTSFTGGLRARFQHEPVDSPLPACRAAREGRTFLVPDRAAAARVHPRMAEVVDVTGRARWALLPLRTEGEVVGSLAVSWTHPAEFTEDEVAVLEVFAAHCAPTVQRLAVAGHDRRATALLGRVARALQRGVLPDLPRLPGLDLAVDYLPAADGAEIGGDFYDAFVRARGDVVVAVGDVAGHDHLAAAAMTRVRTLLRGLAFDSDDGPGALLDRLDTAVAALEPGITATAVLLTATRADDGALDVRWADAGHPPPVLRHPDGTVEVLPDGGEPLLGVDWTAPRREHRRRLPVGSVLVLVTDGVVESRDTEVMTGIGALAQELGGVGTDDAGDAARLCAVLTGPLPPAPGGAGPAGTRDDRTLLVLRVPTPAGAQDAGEDAGEGVDESGGPVVGEVPPDAGGSVTRVVVLAPEPRSAPVARGAVRSVAGAGGWPQDDVDVAELLVSELVANAVVHARSELRVTVASSVDRLLVEVEDENDRLPELLTDDDDALSGRGLRLVDGAAHAWGFRPAPDSALGGKVVWFALQRGRV